VHLSHRAFMTGQKCQRSFNYNVRMWWGMLIIQSQDDTLPNSHSMKIYPKKFGLEVQGEDKIRYRCFLLTFQNRFSEFSVTVLATECWNIYYCKNISWPKFPENAWIFLVNFTPRDTTFWHFLFNYDIIVCDNCHTFFMIFAGKYVSVQMFVPMF